MIAVSNLALQYGKRILFEDVNIRFAPGNCYGVIGANGAGKSTFLKIMSGDIGPNRGEVTIDAGKRMSVLRQNHFEYEEEDVLNVVMMGYRQRYDIMLEKNAIYENPDASEADSLRASELENLYGEMGGWTAESDAAELLSNLGIPEQLHYLKMKDLSGSDKVKILLAQALFGNPDILLLDEPTNDIDAESIDWLCEFLINFPNTVIVVSHNRYFLDMVCTHIVDIDFGKINVFTGNYTFWQETSVMLSRQTADKNKKAEQKKAELMEFIARFSANASKSKQATSRKKALEKLNIEDIKPSNRRYPFMSFKPEREPGDQILKVQGLSKKDAEGKYLFKNVSFSFSKGDKIALICRDSSAASAFLQIIAGEDKAYEGTVEFGQTITYEYLPNDNAVYFTGENNMNLIDWLRQFSKEKDEQFIRGFLGRMLFSGEEVLKKSGVLSGGEKVRCMFSKMMLQNPNFVILDEPTSHLDLESITALNNSLTEFPGNLLFTSHDRQLVQTVANRIIEIAPNGTIDQLMTYDDYLKAPNVIAKRQELYGS
jgi:ATPase subunit of ABC transporter with duplicated ATPase domains